MNTEVLLDKLGYFDSPNFLPAEDPASFQQAADFSHIFRRARERCSLKGVYSLRQKEQEAHDVLVPVVYVCEARDDEHASRIHRQVWNQNVVPFLMITSPKEIRLYSGFRYELHRTGPKRTDGGILRVAEDIHRALDLLDSFRAQKIDDGSLWDEWGENVTPETRVDWRLLTSLNDLDVWLQNNGLEDPEVSHALIGMFVYLSYLRQRNILSDKKLGEWSISEAEIFGRQAQLTSFRKVVGQLDKWLNGSVFPLETNGSARPKQHHIRKVAGTFAGDDPATGQLGLDFGLYDFSFIPIETLSVIYEQFLHAPDAGGSPGRGRAEGAYYTPLPLVNFMLQELDTLCPLRHGMRVLDPACGSGAFLVQCYRRVIEQDKEFQADKPMRPARLRDLLERHIFGVDRDIDACRVAELSLILTLLDYVNPPDLSRTPNFQLPKLFGTNIHGRDFFDSTALWREELEDTRFDWIVGNPPWLELRRSRVSPANQHVWSWMQDPIRRRQFPVSGNQVAEAFAWEVTEYVKPTGWIALILPAMTFFKDEAHIFRKRLFSNLRVRAVANFANMAYVLFPGHRRDIGGRSRKVRSERPAAAVFYSKALPGQDPVCVFSPLVAEQLANRPSKAGGRRDTWNIVIDANQIRYLNVSELRGGDALPWKAAMWGSHLDLRFIRSIENKWHSLKELCADNRVVVSQGLELRREGDREAVEPIPELEGKPRLKNQALRGRLRIFRFPEAAFEIIKKDRCFARPGRHKLPLSVCRPPHVIVDKVRRFAVYSDKFIAVPPRQIGIAGKDGSTDLLKALSIYLISDFALYHQFLLSPEWGVSTSISTLNTLRRLPVPFGAMKPTEVTDWARLRDRLAAAELEDANSLFSENHGFRESLGDLFEELNERVFESLGLREFERALVRDLVHVRMKLIKGKVDEYPIGVPNDAEVRRYGEVVAAELDAFVADQPELRHSVAVVQESRSAIVIVTLHDGQRPAQRVQVGRAKGEAGVRLETIRGRLREKHSQWIYFQRSLRLYEGRTTYLFKPLQRLQWTESQAALDAGSIIAETLA